MASAFRNDQEIEFRRTKRLNEIICRYSVVPHVPDHMCISSSDTLLYVDRSNNLCRVKCLDCSTNPPKSCRNTIHTQEKNLQDICTVKNNGKRLLVTIQDFNPISAYGMKSDELKWSVSGSQAEMKEPLSLQSITTDGRGHLFACDCANKCILMLSTNGKHMEAVLREGEQGLGVPWWIRWSQELSSLIVAHGVDEISVVKPYI